MTSLVRKKRIRLGKSTMFSLDVSGEVLPITAFSGELMRDIEFAGERIKEEDAVGERIKL